MQPMKNEANKLKQGSWFWFLSKIGPSMTFSDSPCGKCGTVIKGDRYNCYGCNSIKSIGSMEISLCTECFKTLEPPDWDSLKEASTCK